MLKLFLLSEISTFPPGYITSNAPYSDTSTPESSVAAEMWCVLLDESITTPIWVWFGGGDCLIVANCCITGHWHCKRRYFRTFSWQGWTGLFSSAPTKSTQIYCFSPSNSQHFSLSSLNMAFHEKLMWFNMVKWGKSSTKYPHTAMPIKRCPLCLVYDLSSFSLKLSRSWNTLECTSLPCKSVLCALYRASLCRPLRHWAGEVSLILPLFNSQV